MLLNEIKSVEINNIKNNLSFLSIFECFFIKKIEKAIIEKIPIQLKTPALFSIKI